MLLIRKARTLGGWRGTRILLVAVVALSGCSYGPGDTVVNKYRDVFTEYRGETYSSLAPATIEFRELTDFEWTTVSVFDAYWARDAIEEQVGVDFLAPYAHLPTTMLVYCNHDRIVRIVDYGNADVWGYQETYTYSADVLWGPFAPNGAHMLKEPDARIAAPQCGGNTA